MRDDQTKDESFQQNDVWRKQKYHNEVIIKSAKDSSGDYLGGRAFTTNSLSGKERNRTFMWSGENFADVSTISGADDISDGRSFALIDFNNDGWQDIALMSLNQPRFKLYKNRLGEIFPERTDLKIRLVGGQSTNEPSSSWSNRDGIGSKVFVNFKGRNKPFLIQRQSGEGFAGQNSSLLRIGTNMDHSIESIEVHWPSGKKSVVDGNGLDLSDRQPLTIYENEER